MSPILLFPKTLQSSIRALVLRLFVGLKNGAGEVLKSDSGLYEVVDIAGLEPGQPIQHIISNQNDIYFIGETQFHRLSPLIKENAEVFQFPDKLISGAFIYKENLFLLCYQEGLFTWSNDELLAVGRHPRMTEDQNDTGQPKQHA